MFCISFASMPFLHSFGVSISFTLSERNNSVNFVPLHRTRAAWSRECVNSQTELIIAYHSVTIRFFGLDCTWHRWMYNRYTCYISVVLLIECGCSGSRGKNACINIKCIDNIVSIINLHALVQQLVQNPVSHILGCPIFSGAHLCMDELNQIQNESNQMNTAWSSTAESLVRKALEDRP